MSSLQPNTTISHVSWGSIEVTIDGQIARFKDCKVWPGGATKWDWTLTGTQHQPGIQPADIKEILDQEIDVMILSRGMHLMLHTCPETVQMLRAQGMEYHIEETQQAVALFNKLMEQGKRAGGIFHSTC